MRWTTAVVLAAALTAIFGRPFPQYATQKLLPIKTLQAEQTAQDVHIVSEVGEGWGADWAAAVEDLKRNAAGDVFFQTAERAFFCDRRLARQAVLSGDLRPAARVCFSDKIRPTEALCSAAESRTVAELRAAYAGENAG